jgi:hypothetical protein
MEQGHMLFPELATPPAPAAPPDPPARRDVIRFMPRPSGYARREPSRLDGTGLANRLRRDVERQIAHRRRMLGHLEGQRSVNGKS